MHAEVEAIASTRLPLRFASRASFTAAVLNSSLYFFLAMTISYRTRVRLGTLKVARDFPDVKFESITGYKTTANVSAANAPPAARSGAFEIALRRGSRHLGGS